MAWQLKGVFLRTSLFLANSIVHIGLKSYCSQSQQSDYVVWRVNTTIVIRIRYSCYTLDSDSSFIRTMTFVLFRNPLSLVDICFLEYTNLEKTLFGSILSAVVDVITMLNQIHVRWIANSRYTVEMYSSLTHEVWDKCENMLDSISVFVLSITCQWQQSLQPSNFEIPKNSFSDNYRKWYEKMWYPQTMGLNLHIRSLFLWELYV